MISCYIIKFNDSAVVKPQTMQFSFSTAIFIYYVLNYVFK